MSLISGYQKIKKMIKTANGYQLLSLWTSSDTVEMKDGTTLEDRICNVNNTADQDKPISTAQQNALNQKADLVSPALNGTPTAPTPPYRTNTSQIATTAFVQTAVSDGIAESLSSLDVTDLAVVSTKASQGLSDAEKKNARENIGAGTSSFSGSYTDLKNKPTIPTASSFLGNGTGYVAPAKNGGNANDYKSEYHGFVFNMTNIPYYGGNNYGFLDVSYFNGSGFSPSANGCVRQVFTHYSTGAVFTRMYYNSTWSSWVRCLLTTETASNADKLDGYHGSVNADGNTYVLRDTSGSVAVNKITGTFRNHILIGEYTNVMTIFNTLYSDDRTCGIKFTSYSASYYVSPTTNNYAYLGDADHKWKEVWAINGTIQTSDRRKKKDISYIGMDSDYDTYMSEDQLKKFIMGLLPCIYRRTDGESGRPHHGLIAQDIEELIKEIGLSDHAGFIKSPKTRDIEVEKEIEEEIKDPETGEVKTIKKLVKELQQEEIPGEYTYSLRYEEFIADIIRFIQLQNERIDKLEERLNRSE